MSGVFSVRARYLLLALLECVLDQFLPGDIRNRADPATEIAFLVDDRNSLAKEPVGSPVGGCTVFQRCSFSAP